MVASGNDAKFTLCLCLAGLGSRFTKEGYTTPKFLLPMKDGVTAILKEILLGFQGMEQGVALLVFNERYTDWKPQIDEALSGLPFDVVVRFIGDTQGQAETAMRAIGFLEEALPQMVGKPLIFHNGDTVLYGRDAALVAEKLQSHDGVIDSFAMNSPAYSYVVVDDHDVVTEMREKVVISDRATTGMYGFKDVATYTAYYTLAAGQWQKEFYISDVYRAMLDKGASILNMHYADAALTLNLGTPAEYEAYLKAEAA